MRTSRKFGTFGGVFTPSILTILGVIMYMRLPWIVGQAGLYTTLGIILVAHLISVTSGLSVSSIATDKNRPVAVDTDCLRLRIEGPGVNELSVGPNDPDLAGLGDLLNPVTLRGFRVPDIGCSVTPTAN